MKNIDPSKYEYPMSVRSFTGALVLLTGYGPNSRVFFGELPEFGPNGFAYRPVIWRADGCVLHEPEMTESGLDLSSFPLTLEEIEATREQMRAAQAVAAAVAKGRGYRRDPRIARAIDEGKLS